MEFFFAYLQNSSFFPLNSNLGETLKPEAKRKRKEKKRGSEKLCYFFFRLDAKRESRKLKRKWNLLKRKNKKYAIICPFLFEAKKIWS
jgi:hypothetical protein